MPSLATPQLGKQIARYRKALKMSAEDLAMLADNGLTRSIVANLENDRKHNVTTAQLLAIAFVLGVSPADLLFDLRLPYTYMEIVPAGEGRQEVRLPTWLAREWFGGALASIEAAPMLDREPASENRRDAFKEVSAGERSRAYYLRRRSDLLITLKLLKDELRAAREAAWSSDGALDTSSWDQRIRDTQSELYEVETGLRQLGVRLEDPPIHPTPLLPF